MQRSTNGLDSLFLTWTLQSGRRLETMPGLSRFRIWPLHTRMPMYVPMSCGREGKGTSDDDPQKKCDTGVCAWSNSDAVRETFSFIMCVRLARRGQETSEQGGGWEAAGF